MCRPGKTNANKRIKFFESLEKSSWIKWILHFFYLLDKSLFLQLFVLPPSSCEEYWYERGFSPGGWDHRRYFLQRAPAALSGTARPSTTSLQQFLKCVIKRAMEDEYVFLCLEDITDTQTQQKTFLKPETWNLWLIPNCSTNPTSNQLYSKTTCWCKCLQPSFRCNPPIERGWIFQEHFSKYSFKFSEVPEPFISKLCG